jgi:diguanylate cyclase (GGDEF)-like protein
MNEAVERTATEDNAMQQTLHTTRLLIVDDDLVVRTVVAAVLRASGFEVVEADDGHSGLAQIEKCRPDLVLLDVMMPGMDGYEVCGALRGRSETAHIPVIMLTGLNDTASIERAYESGATDFVMKPINPALLGYRVRYALRASRMLEEIDQHRASLANAQRIAHLGSWTWHPSSGRRECSAEYQRVIGEEALGPDHRWRDSLRRVHREDVDRVAQAIEAAIGAGEAYAIVYRILDRDGAERTVYEQTQVIHGADGRVVRIDGTTQDITERVAAEERIRQLADYDGLTGLANRRLFSEIMQHAVNRSRRKAVNVAVLDINLDRFKRINETLGHEVGDQVLQEVGRRIVESIRAGDLAGAIQDGPRASVSARMTGDGFAVLLSEIRRAEDAAVIARRLSEAIALPMQCAERELTLTASIGIAVYPDNGEEVSTLLKNAETALHRAKERGTGTYCFFTSAMNAQAVLKLETENDLRAAIERDELQLFYQARVDVPTGRIVGAEALLRWQHPRRGLVPPGEFVPVAEEAGLIVPMTEWVLRGVCRQLKQWRQAGLPVVPVSINFSAHSFREDGLAALIAACLRESGIPASLLEAEITESMLLQHVGPVVTRLDELRAMGVGLSVDDFGTGYSSLAYLKHFPVHVLKIDRAFVQDVLTDTHDAAIASTIITLGKTIGMSVVAEGMERVEQANFLLSLGCRVMQGFLFAQPLPAAAFARILGAGLAMPTGLRSAEEPLTLPDMRKVLNDTQKRIVPSA